MDQFDPAINYGPNDAGISSLSIVLLVLGVLFGSWAFGALYALVSNYLQQIFKKND